MTNPKRPLIIDVEASGFGSLSYPIEVGVALSDGERFCSLILPIPEWTHWDDSAENVHGISKDILLEHGKSVVDVAKMLNEQLEGKTLYSDGWVVDKPWLVTLFHAAHMQMAFRLSPLELILSEHQMAVWHQTKDRITDEMGESRHRASYDAWVVQETYNQTYDKESQ